MMIFARVLVIGLALVAASTSPRRVVAGDGGGFGVRPFVAVHQELSATVAERSTSALDPDLTLTTRLRASVDINLEPEYAYRYVVDLTENDETVQIELITVGGIQYARFGEEDWLGVPAGLLMERLPWQNFTPGVIDDQPAFAALRAAGLTVVTLPPEELRGVPVRHARIEIRDAAAAALLSQTLPPSLALVFGSDLGLPDSSSSSNTEEGRITIDLWNGLDNGFPYRATFVGEGDAGRYEATSDQFPLYERVAIEPPPDVRVVGRPAYTDGYIARPLVRRSAW